MISPAVNSFYKKSNYSLFHQGAPYSPHKHFVIFASRRIDKLFMLNKRLIKLNGAENFRDIGGCELQSGNKLKEGILFRSDELSRLSRSDNNKLGSLEIKTIIDVRTEKEIKYRPDRLTGSKKINYINIPIHPSNNNISYLRYFKSFIAKKTGNSYEDFLREHYKIVAFDRFPQLNKIFTIISDGKNLPALIHCSVGKDRTGFISALIQLLAGVTRENVLSDYLASNSLTINRRNRTILFLRIISLFRVSKNKIMPLFEAKEEYLNLVLDEIFLKYGSIENYLIKGCGMNKNRITELKNILTS